MSLLWQTIIALSVIDVCFIALGTFVAFQRIRKDLKWTFVLYTLSLSVWTTGQASAMYISDHSLSLLAVRLCHIGVVMIPVLLVHFLFCLSGVAQQKNPLIKKFYIISAFFEIANTTPLIVRDVTLRPHWKLGYIFDPGLLYPVFLLFWFYTAIYGFVIMFKAYQVAEGQRRIQLQYLLWGMLPGYMGGVPNYLFGYDIVIPILMPYGTYLFAFYVAMTAYAIVRYQFMDINIAVTRTAVFAVVYALLLGLPLGGALEWQTQLEGWWGRHWWVWVWLGGAGLTTVAHYVNLYLQRKAEARLLREQRRYQSTLLQASRGMTEVRDLKRLLNLIVHVITKAVGLTHAAIFLAEPGGQGFTLKAARHEWHLTAIDRLAEDDPLIELLKDAKEPLVREEINAEIIGVVPKDRLTFLKTMAFARMKGLDAEVVVPSFVEARLIGFVVLGPKRKGHIFSTEDLTVFSTLANQAAIAIENAKFYEEEKQRQAALFHAATLASLGTMASSMGHQVNNRFNVVSVISSAQKAKLKPLLDASSGDAEQLRKALADCYAQFESLEEEAMRGGQIVSSIRKLAKPSTGGHQPLTLDAAIKAGVDVVQHKIHLDEIDFQVDLAKDLPMVSGDLSQLGDCFLNLIDNAYDAIKTKEQLIAEGKLSYINGTKPFRGSIAITARLKDPSTIQVDVADNGLGVEAGMQQKLFVPFFTTKATAEKGTGLGLYVMKKILEAHGGTIRMQSTYGRATVFTIELPVAKDAPVAA